MIIARATAEVVALLSTAVATILTVRTIGPAMAGNLAIASTLFYLSTVAVGGGIPSFGAQQVAIGAGDGLLVRSALVARFAVAVIWIPIVELIAFVIPVSGPLRELIVWTTLGSVAIAGKHEWYLVGRGQVGMASVVRACSAIGTLAIAVLVVRPDDTLSLALFVLVGPLIAAALSSVATARLVASGPPRTEGPIRGVRETLRGGLHYLTADLSIFVYNNSDRPMVYAFGGAVAAGLYDAAYKLIQPFSAVGAVVNDTLFRSLATMPRSGPAHDAVMRRFADLMFVSTIPVGFFTLGFAEPLVDLVYGPQFAGAGRLLSLLGWVATVGYVSGVLAMPLAAWQAPRPYGNAILAGSIANVVLNVALIPPFLGTGAAWATIAAKAVVAAIALRPFRARSAYPVGRDLLQYGVASGLALIAGVLARSLTGTVVVGVGVFALVYVLAVASVVLMRRGGIPLRRRGSS